MTFWMVVVVAVLMGFIMISAIERNPVTDPAGCLFGLFL